MSAEPGALTQDPGPQGCFSEAGQAPCPGGRALGGPTAIAATKDGRHVYVASYATGAVAVLTRDRMTGALTQAPGPEGCISKAGSSGQCAEGRAIDYSPSIAVSPDDKHVYAASSFSSAVAVLVRDKTTGGLSQLPGPEGCISEDGSGGQCADGRALNKPTSVAVSPNGKHVYVAAGDSNAVAVLQRDRRTGALTQLPGPEGCVSADGSGGQCTIGRVLGYPYSVAVSKDGKHVYVASYTSHGVAVLQRDPRTGALTPLPGPAGCIDLFGGGCAKGRVAFNYPFSLSISPDGKHVYVASLAKDAVAVLQRDRATGALSQLPGPAGCISEDGSGGECTDARALDRPYALVFPRDGKHLYVASFYSDAVAALDRDPTTGALTQRAGQEGCIAEYDGGRQCTDGRALYVPVAMAASTDGKQVYAVSGYNSAVAVLQREK